MTSGLAVAELEVDEIGAPRGELDGSSVLPLGSCEIREGENICRSEPKPVMNVKIEITDATKAIAAPKAAHRIRFRMSP